MVLRSDCGRLPALLLQLAVHALRTEILGTRVSISMLSVTSAVDRKKQYQLLQTLRDLGKKLQLLESNE